MDCKIFFSWQSDLPSTTNEQFIEETLKSVVNRIRVDSSLDMTPILDRDIVNVPGSPDVAATILAKIEASDIFICDVSIINKRKYRNNANMKITRLTSNPNVLVEFGYALKTLGTDKIILVNNLAFGKHEDLPFDFRHKFVIGYNLSQEFTIEQHEVERHSLETQLEQKIRQIIFLLKEAPSQKPSLFNQVITAIENSQPNRTILINKLIDEIIKQLKEWSPPFPKAEGNEIDLIMKSIDQTADLILELTQLFSSVAISDDSKELVSFYKNIFERIIIEYNVPIGFGGSYNPARILFYQFIGHELFISFTALLIDMEKFDIINDILSETLYVENTHNGPKNVAYSYISLNGESSQYSYSASIVPFAEKLNQRHKEGDLANLMPIARFIDAEVFLSLRVAPPKWYPFTDKISYQLPKFLIRSLDRKYAQKLLKPLGVENVNQLKDLIFHKGQIYRWIFGFDINSIASE